MPNKCSECGAELREDSKFCLECGKKVEQPIETPKESPPQKQEEQPKTPIAKPKPKKPRTKLMIGLVGIIIAVVIVIVLAIYFSGGTSPLTVADSRFVGQWEQNTVNGPRQWVFNSDSTLNIYPTTDTLINGSWKVTNNQICLYSEIICYSFAFSNDGNIITLTRVGGNENYLATIVLSKKGLQGTTQTPEITCRSDSSTNRITIESVDANVKWSDIVITTNTNASWQVQDTNQRGLARIGITSTITTYVNVGDSILLVDATGDVIVTLRYLPTNTVLGNWTINV